MKGDEDVAHIGIRLDEREKDQITELAQKKDLTLSQIVRKLLRDYLNKEDEKVEKTNSRGRSGIWKGMVADWKDVVQNSDNDCSACG